jgi:hypothetical protein
MYSGTNFLPAASQNLPAEEPLAMPRLMGSPVYRQGQGTWHPMERMMLSEASLRSATSPLLVSPQLASGLTQELGPIWNPELQHQSDMQGTSSSCPLVPGCILRNLSPGSVQDPNGLMPGTTRKKGPFLPCPVVHTSLPPPAGFSVHTCQKSHLHPPPLGRAPCRSGGFTSVCGGLWVLLASGTHSDKGAA